MELLEGRQQVILATAEKEKGGQFPPPKDPPAPEKKDGFDPFTELVPFGEPKKKGQTWIQAPKAWLTWLMNESQKPDIKEKAKLTLEAQKAQGGK